MMAADIWSAVQWWEQRQLRILVLGSLGVQWFLLFAAPMRRYSIPHWFRKCIWLAYLGSDALAIYALATLFNRHSREGSCSCSCASGNGSSSSSSALEVLWAPVLLIHLGGQQEMTAYNMEDNELWTRHTLTLVSQVTIALYAFCKSWPISSTDRRLSASAILLFIIGILSFGEKPWALRKASMSYRLAAVSSALPAERITRKASKWESLFTKLGDKQNMCWKRRMPRPQETRQQHPSLLSSTEMVHMILSDMSPFAADSDTRKRKRMEHKNEGSMRETLEDKVARKSEGNTDVDDEIVGSALSPTSTGLIYTDLKSWLRPLRKVYGLIYTRDNVTSNPAYLVYHLVLVPSLHAAAITLFLTSDKHGYNGRDIRTTFILLFFTAAHNVLAVFIRRLLHMLMSAAGVPALCETLSQYNVLSSARRRMEPCGWILRCAARLGLEEEYFVCKHDQSLSEGVAGHVILDLVSATTGTGRGKRLQGLDLASYRSFTEENWVLHKELQELCSITIKRSMCESFDKSVLLWHVATELCFRLSRPPPGDALTRSRFTLAISNYMAHLLNFRPDMLMTGSRRHLSTQALQDLEDIIILSTGTSSRTTKVDDAAVLAAILNAASGNSSERHKYPLIHDACKLSDELMKVRPEETRWELMYRVWLGMLCYSANMCRGFLHAKSLGEGGEFLSFVWVVLSLMGTKTLADKLQMPEPDAQQESQAAGGEETAATATATARPSTDDDLDLEWLVDRPGKNR